MYSVEEITRTAFSIVGMAARVSNSQPDAIGLHWQRFLSDQTIARIHNKTSPNIFSAYTEYESDYTGPYTLLLGYTVPPSTPTPPGLRSLDVPEQKYAVIQARGEQPQATIAAWQWVWASRLDRAYTVDFDEYVGSDIVKLHIAVR